MRTTLTLIAALITSVATVACDPQPTGPQNPADAVSTRFARGGNGGAGGPGGPGGDPEPVLALRVDPTTTAGLANGFSGDGRDGDGTPALPAGHGVYRDGVCGIDVRSGLIQSAGAPDTLNVRIFIQDRLKRNDLCPDPGSRAWGVSFPPNPVYGSDESLVSLGFKWQPDDAVSNGQVTNGIGKLNIRGQSQTCNPLRYHPTRNDGLFALSDYVRVERIEGGWRLFTQPAPNNVGQCQDSSGQGNDPILAGEAIPLDFEFYFDEDVGDGIGPVG